ncbi:MAG: HEAT repeat domain-containing protein, partial [Dehalococcoidia bacterium]|nr:HEAT repeat domain-containing protein [Dehalococcoidia bacterium]
AEALMKLGDKSAVSALSKSLADSDWPVRRYAAEALGKMGYKGAVPFLIKDLADWSDTVRLRAAEALGKLGDKDAVPHLGKTLTDSDKYVRIAAAEALCRFGYGTELLPFDYGNDRFGLTKALMHEDTAMRVRAIEIVWRFEYEWAMPYLLRATKDNNSRVRAVSAVSLTQFGYYCDVSHIIEALSDPDFWVRCAAAQAVHWEAYQVTAPGADEVITMLSDLVRRYFRLGGAIFGYDKDHLESLLRKLNNPMELAQRSQVMMIIEESLRPQNERYRQVLALRFGLDDGRSRTLADVGKLLNLSGSRIGQIEAKALRMLRHPSRSSHLEHYLE